MLADTRTLLAARLVARAPRIALLCAAGVLAVAGLRGAVAPPKPTTASAVAPRPAPAAAAPFAEAFVREYLSWEQDDIGGREQRLSAYLADGLDPDAGLAPTPGRRSRVSWTVAGVPRAAGGAVWSVDVLAGLQDGTRTTMSIPVHARGNAMAVVDYPALVALGTRATDAPARSWNTPVEDAGLERVVQRALRNYLAGRAGDLQADLAPGSRVITPERTSRLITVEELAWKTPGREVAALVVVELPDRSRMRLRLHLSVRRDGRWFVAGLNTPTPPTQGAPR